jgi:TPR repeat protein
MEPGSSEIDPVSSEIDPVISKIDSLISGIDSIISGIGPRYEGVDPLIAEIDSLRDGSAVNQQEAAGLALENRDKSIEHECLYQTFVLLSPEHATAVEFLNAHKSSTIVAARLGYYLTQKGNVAQGIQLLQQAASAGHPFAQYVLAIMLYQGNNVPKDVPRAVENLKTLDAQNFLPAKYNLGVHYYMTPFEAKGDEKGLNLIREAAKLGYPEAMKTLPALEKRAIMWGVAATSY